MIRAAAASSECRRVRTRCVLIHVHTVDGVGNVERGEMSRLEILEAGMLRRVVCMAVRGTTAREQARYN